MSSTLHPNLVSYIKLTIFDLYILPNGELNEARINSISPNDLKIIIMLQKQTIKTLNELTNLSESAKSDRQMYLDTLNEILDALELRSQYLNGRGKRNKKRSNKRSSKHNKKRNKKSRRA